MDIFKKYGIKTDNKKIYDTAFSHTSYANENKTESYERLEFLGDAVLELLMSDYLYKKYNYPEGKMTKIRSHYVCEIANCEYSKRIGLDKYLKLGHGEEENGGRKNRAIVSDIFESFLGALYLDQGIIFTKNFFDENIIPIIESKEIDFFDDYKSMLQEYVQTDKKSLEYKLVGESGPAHDKHFKVEVVIDGIVYGVGEAGSKKKAEKEAAKNALSKAQKGRFKWEELMK